MTAENEDGRSHVRLGGGAEFDTIRDFLARWGDGASGVGDDAATLELPRGGKLVVSVAAFVAGRPFEPARITPPEIGHRAVAAALDRLRRRLLSGPAGPTGRLQVEV